jgi:uncharacterized protein
MLSQTNDRPWQIPERNWCLAMGWHELLFAHWPVDPSALRSLLPRGLQLDLYDGQAWLGIVPFWMSGVRCRFGPAVPWISKFPEINLRTYVTAEGKPGVWFFSLDATRWLAVRAARLLHLPYYDAQIVIRYDDPWITYHSRRTHRDAPQAEFQARYRPTGDVYNPRPGQLDHWLTYRYALYTVDQRGRLARLEVDHAPWPLQPAEAEITLNRMTEQIGVELPNTAPRFHFSRRLDTIAWWPQRLPDDGRS